MLRSASVCPDASSTFRETATGIEVGVSSAGRVYGKREETGAQRRPAESSASGRGGARPALFDCDGGAAGL